MANFCHSLRLDQNPIDRRLFRTVFVNADSGVDCSYVVCDYGWSSTGWDRSDRSRSLRCILWTQPLLLNNPPACRVMTDKLLPLFSLFNILLLLWIQDISISILTLCYPMGQQIFTGFEGRKYFIFSSNEMIWTLTDKSTKIRPNLHRFRPSADNVIVNLWFISLQ